MPRLVEISSGVLVATSRREATTSTVIVGPSARVLLVDPAWEPDELDALAAELAAAGLQVEAGLATHAHYDHVLWHPDFGQVPRWASEETVRTVTDERQALLGELGPGWPARLAEVVGHLDVLERPQVSWSGPPVELVEHGGHQAGHLAAWLPESRVLVAGDMLSDVELPIADETQPLEVYAEGLERLRPYAAAAAIVVPGHGTVGHRPLARWEADQHYISALLNGGDPADPRCTNDGMAEIHDANLRVARERR